MKTITKRGVHHRLLEKANERPPKDSEEAANRWSGLKEKEKLQQLLLNEQFQLCCYSAIESMHWLLDVSMQEDASQIYKDNAAENLSCLRHMGLNMLRAEPTKPSIAGKQKRCWMKTEHLKRF